MSKLYIFKTVGILVYSCIPFKKEATNVYVSIYTYQHIVRYIYMPVFMHIYALYITI